MKVLPTKITFNNLKDGLLHSKDLYCNIKDSILKVL